MIHALILLVSISSASADHQARFETESNHERIPDMSGEILIRDSGDVRMNTDKPASLSVLIKKSSKKATILIHLMKMTADTDIQKYEKQIPECVGKAIDSCLSQSGFKKSQSEKDESGIVENVYLKSNKDGKVTLWVPQKSKSPFPSKMLVESKDGLVVTTRFSNPKELKLDASLFAPPKGYKKSSGFDSLLKAGESMLAPKKTNE